MLSQPFRLRSSLPVRCSGVDKSSRFGTSRRVNRSAFRHLWPSSVPQLRRGSAGHLGFNLIVRSGTISVGGPGELQSWYLAAPESSGHRVAPGPPTADWGNEGLDRHGRNRLRQASEPLGFTHREGAPVRGIERPGSGRGCCLSDSPLPGPEGARRRRGRWRSVAKSAGGVTLL